MRFTSLHMSDFRGTRELDISFEPDVTVIVGRNGSGKTSILDALAITIGIARAHPRQPGRIGFEVGVSGQDIRSGADMSRLEVGYETRDPRSGACEADSVPVKLDRYVDPRNFPFLQDDEEALARLTSRQLRFVYYRQERGFGSGRQAGSPESATDTLDPEAVQDRSLGKDLHAISDLGTWWDQRDAQEARRVRDGESSYRDPQLEAVRELIARIDGFTGLAFNSTSSPPGLHFVKNDGTSVHVSGLSGGERSYIILLADLARRLQVFAPGGTLGGIPAIVLIDEIELNLHPGWQSEIIPTLREVFSSCQFIVTTHSPQVLSGVENTRVRVIEEEVPDWSWKVTVPLSTRGRTSNYLLEGVLGARERFPRIDRMIGDFNAAIDSKDVPGAASSLDEIERNISDDTPTLLVLRKRLKKLRDEA